MRSQLAVIMNVEKSFFLQAGRYVMKTKKCYRACFI